MTASRCTRVPRRDFLGRTLAAMGVVASVGRRAWAQMFEPRYHPLVRPVVVPLESLATPGRAVPFVAEGMTLPSAAMPNQPIRITGMVIRTGAGDNAADRFRAIDVKCPHEGCDVDFVGNPSTLASEITDQIGHPVNDPVYVCPCHNSTFRIDDGERMAGPAPRGLYRFRVTNVSETAVEIGEVEEDVLLFA
jgi:Rieske Fe-S protein